MKKLLILCTVLFAFTACGDVEPLDAGLVPTNPGTGATNGTGTLRIDNVNRTISSLLAIEEPSSAGQPALISIAYASDNDALFLLLDAAIIPGTYDVDDMNFDIASLITEDLVNSVPTTSFFDVSGTVTITSHDMTANTMVGTFNISYEDFAGTLTRTASGTFTVSY